ncbi:MAG: rhodanese-related sulfurtransferase [Candidatus Berkiella sp.]
MEYLNLSGYQFKKLTNLETLREDLKHYCREIGLKGSILLSHEGINAFVAGPQEVIDRFQASLERFNLPKLNFKISYSDNIPFKRMLVKIKPEIISMGEKDIDPEMHPAPYISPETLKQWIDEDKDIVILDTRNDYEVHLGKFKNAVDLNIDHFRKFPAACQNLPSEWKNKPIVTYCTGGIRCEKAAPYLQSLGFNDVYQLDGGILSYFEKCDKAHFEGECFVFDKRIAVDNTLAETSTIQCYKCRMPITAEQQQSEHYRLNEYCPSCYPNHAKTP